MGNALFLPFSVIANDPAESVVFRTQVEALLEFPLFKYPDKGALLWTDFAHIPDWEHYLASVKFVRDMQDEDSKALDQDECIALVTTFYSSVFEPYTKHYLNFLRASVDVLAVDKLEAKKVETENKGDTKSGGEAKSDAKSLKSLKENKDLRSQWTSMCLRYLQPVKDILPALLQYLTYWADSEAMRELNKEYPISWEMQQKFFKLVQRLIKEGLYDLGS